MKGIWALRLPSYKWFRQRFVEHGGLTLRSPIILKLAESHQFSNWYNGDLGSTLGLCLAGSFAWQGFWVGCRVAASLCVVHAGAWD